MNAQPNPDRDDDINRLLSRRYCDTSGAFEARWTELKRELRQAPVRRRSDWRAAWSLWLGVLGAAAVLVFVLQLRPLRDEPGTAAPMLSPELAELFAMDAALSRAAPLLNEENRTVLLHLPASNES